jgi:hypothetical protein
VYSGNEDNGSLLEARMLRDHVCQFKAVQFRHADIDENDSNIVLQQALKSFICGMCLDQILAELTRLGSV